MTSNALTDEDGQTSGGGTVIYGFVVALGRAIPALSVFVLGFLFDPAEYGRIAVLSVLYSFLMVAADGGFDVASTIALRDETDSRSFIRQIRGGLLGRLITVTACSSLLAAATLATAERRGAAIAGLLGLTVAALAAAATGSARLWARLEFPVAEARLFLMEKAAVGALCVGISLAWRSASAFVVAVMAGPALILLTTRRPRTLLAKDAGVPQLTRCFDATRSQAAMAAPVALGLAATTLYWRLDVLLIAALEGHAAAGGYAIAYYPLMALTALPGAASVLVLRNHSTRAAARSMAALFFVGGVLASAVLVTVAAPLLQASSLSAITKDTGDVLRVAALGVPAMFANPFLAMGLRGEGKAWSATGIVLVALTVNVAANLLLIPVMGVQGAAWSSTGTEWVALVALIVVLRRTRVRLPSQRCLATETSE